METTLLTTKVKCCFFILYLCCQQYFLETSASINKSDVAKYLIERKAGRDVDGFSVLFKQGCNENRCNPTCDDLSADPITSSRENFNRSCACKYDSRTFLPEKGKCLPDNQAANTLKGVQTLSAVGCSKNLLSWTELFLNGFNLTTSGEHENYLKGRAFQSCEVISRSPMYYDSLEERWKRICSEIFTVKFESGPGIILKWEADKNNTLSGRIVRLSVTCRYSSANKTLNGCLLFKAAGTVSYNYVKQSVAQDSGCPSSTISSLVPTVSTSVTSSLLLSPSSILPSPSSFLSSSWSSSSAVTTTVRVSLKTPTASLASSSFFSQPSPNSQTSDQSKITDSNVVSPSTPEARNTVSFSSSKGLHNTVVTTTILKPAIKTSVFSVNPSKPSLTTKEASSSAVIERPGNKKARVNGNDNGVVIGAAVGGAAVFGIFIIITMIVFCKRRKLWRNKEKTTKPQVIKNPVYGSSDIPLSSATENQATALMEQDSQPTYQDLITDSGKMSGGAIYSSSDDNDYDNYSAYQSLDKKVPGSPVYQSLTKGQLNTGQPTSKSKSSATGPPSERPEATVEPVYNVIEQPDTEQGAMPEEENGVPEHDSHGGKQEPVYNVLDESDTEENYEAPDVDDSLYNVLEEPESKQDPQEPCYDVLENSDAEKSSNQGAHGSCGLSNEPLYNVVEGPGSDGPKKNGLDYDAPNGSTSPDAHDNPAYEESLDFEPNKNGVGSDAPNGSSPDAHDNPAYEESLDFVVPYASVHRPGPQRESVYEPLRGPNDQDLYEPLK